MHDKVFEFETDLIRLAVAPGLGSKMLSLQDLRNGHEWLWSSQPGSPLHTNHVGDPFESGNLCGVDECIPTVAPCRVDEQELPDHGEAWSKPWAIEELDKDAARLTTAVWLCGEALRFQRSIVLDGDQVRLGYELTNHSDQKQAVLWAFHPLFAITDHTVLSIGGLGGSVGRVDYASGAGLSEGDEIRFPEASSEACFKNLSLPWQSCLKAFYPLKNLSGRLVAARLDEPGIGSVELIFKAGTWINSLGLWLNRGGWNDYTHFAIEPTNGMYDRLSQVMAEAPPLTWCLDPGESRSWRLLIRLHTSLEH